MLFTDYQIFAYIYSMIQQDSENTQLLLARYKLLMEEAYNLRQIDPALSDYDFYEGLKIRALLELQNNFTFKNKINDLLE